MPTPQSKIRNPKTYPDPDSERSEEEGEGSAICDYESSPWRTEFWRGREYEDRAERIALAKLLPPSRGRRRLVEIGAGFGRLAEFYAGYEHVILLDYARSMLLDAREQIASRFPLDASLSTLHSPRPTLHAPRPAPLAPRFTFVAADLYQLPFTTSAFDTAITVRVLHHVADIPRAFAEIARILRPQGAYVLEFANKRHLKARLRYALNRNAPNPNTLDPYEFVKLNFDFHPRYIDARLRAENLVTQEKLGVSMLRIPFLKRAIPAPILAALDGILQSPLSNLSIAPSLFIRARSTKPGAPALNAALWRCVACGSTDIAETREALTCGSCARVYPVIDGIVDFRSVDAETR